jgi:sugar O-acyltransferase (sialic acid O-acetyltransferase NeuD family)
MPPETRFLAKPVIILGAGGHARVLIEALRRSGITVLGLVDARLPAGGTVAGMDILGSDETLERFVPDTVELVNGIGSLPGRAGDRVRVFLAQKRKGYRFATVVHPSAVLAEDLALGEGAQVMAGAIVQPGVRIGINAIVNSGAIIDHDCLIGDHCHIAPGAVLSGNVRVGARVHVGTGAKVIQGIEIGRKAVVAAGATVYRSIAEGVRYIPGQ